MNLWIFFLVIGSASWFLTTILRRYAITSSLLDVPNDRSSHLTPVPRGGGVAILITFIFGLFFLWVGELLGLQVIVAFLGASFLVASVGFIDDHGHVAARWRLLAHFCAAGWLLFWLGGLPPLVFFGFEFDLGWGGHLLACIALVWLLNLYNFMDGIDGIAGIEALSSSMLVGLLFLFVLGNINLSFIHLLMSASVVGFLMWNLPPAKIFMGDAGSGFIGSTLGGLILYSAHVAQQMFWVWLIILGIFIVDATYTLIRRLLQGKQVYVAHRCHAYQYASRLYGGHLPVSLSVLLINVCWLAPWSVVVAYSLVDGAVAMLCAYIPLLWLAWYFHAGEEEKSPEVGIT
ncbi:MAG: glycosyltransferase family 4 protein [Gammaproteobacteria bacterium]|nr:glycosyltransferase family 4 protein [Gammaproteobacteria bacterium]